MIYVSFNVVPRTNIAHTAQWDATVVNKSIPYNSLFLFLHGQCDLSMNQMPVLPINLLK